MMEDKVGRPFKTWDADGRYDVVVIGSGMGAMTTAAVLAKKARKRVLVLERHYTVGGFTHVFRRPGYEWDVGLHYCGEMHRPGSEMRAIFDYVTDGRVAWESTGDVYDRIVTPSGSYDLVAGTERFRERLKAYFPSETRAVDRYLKLVHSCFRAARPFLIEKALPMGLSGLLGPLLRMPFLRHSRHTTREVLESLTRDRELIGVLAGQWYDYGLPPARSSFGMHAILVHHYLEGAAYPVGGASRVAAAIAPAILDAGGEILVRAEVERIVVERGRAVGVRMSDGREIRAGLVVSGAGVRNTFTRLLPTDGVARFGLAEQLADVEPSLAHLNLYVGLNGSDEELGLGRANLWVFPSPDHDRNVADFLADPERPLPLTWICFSSAKDPSFAKDRPGRSTVQLMTYAAYDSFRRWERTSWQRRGEDYEAMKQRYSERLLNVLHRHVPSTRGRIAHAELATPLTTRRFSNHPNGEIYGLAATPERFRRRLLQPRSPIRNLFLTGQDIAVPGVAGAMLGGVLCAAAILGVWIYPTILHRGRRHSALTNCST